MSNLNCKSSYKYFSVIVLLGLSAEFYTLNHSILIYRLHPINGTVLVRFKSYLLYRYFSININFQYLHSGQSIMVY